MILLSCQKDYFGTAFVFTGSNATSSKGNNFLISGVMKPSVTDVLDHLEMHHHWGMQLCQINAKYNDAKLMQCVIIHSFLIKEMLSKTHLQYTKISATFSLEVQNLEYIGNKTGL